MAKKVPTAISEYMAKLGSKGGKKSGAKRMEMPEAQRREIALKAAKARWAKRSPFNPRVLEAVGSAFRVQF